MNPNHDPIQEINNISFSAKFTNIMEGYHYLYANFLLKFKSEFYQVLDELTLKFRSRAEFHL